MTNAVLADRTVQHWCVRLAQSAQWSGAEDLSIPARANIVSAWAAVITACRITDDVLAREVARSFRLHVAQWDSAQLRATKLVPERLARKHLVYPLRENDRTIWIAIADPNDMAAEQEVGFASGRNVVMEVSSPETIRSAIGAGYAPENAAAALLHAAGGDVDSATAVKSVAGLPVLKAEEASAAPVVALANLILHDAIKRRASDVHIEPGRNNGVVRFRVDGLMYEYLQLPMPVFNRVVSRIKVMGELDIADRMRPQDGRSRIVLPEGRSVDLRLSTVPTRDSEKVVIRILDTSSTRKLAEVCLSPHELASLRTLSAHRDGIVLVTGPTGSGKTTTLYAAIQEIASGAVNITTIEDPVEFEVSGITQIQVESKRGVTFASALRAVLRQDPDVIFVGEIRDRETAETAAHAALTGHLVLSTLHTNDAIGVVARLEDLGLDPPTIASSLRGAVAQRLVRRLCPHCSVPAGDSLTPDEARLHDLTGVKPVRRQVGCEQCVQFGFLGRAAVVEVFVVSPAIKAMITARESAAALLRRARSEGMRTLVEAALDIVRAGDTTLEEVERVVGFADLLSPSATLRGLVVDDDPAMRGMVRVLLEQAGFEVQEAAGGGEALAIIAASGPPSLLMLDLELPGKSGRDVLRALRAGLVTRQLPVVILTGSDDEQLEPVVMDEGADDYLRKPIDPARFGARIRAVLRRAGQR
jgi:type II secretory ATPase GspE/PulE/Tfp pilus assembly ATPase PilB-like protein/ActR/RegA family two-component response regulator